MLPLNECPYSCIISTFHNFKINLSNIGKYKKRFRVCWHKWLFVFYDALAFVSGKTKFFILYIGCLFTLNDKVLRVDDAAPYCSYAELWRLNAVRCWWLLLFYENSLS